MCGLWGYYGAAKVPLDKRKELIIQLGRKAQARGTDSWGVAFKNSKGVAVRRAVGPISDALYRGVHGTRHFHKSDVVIGHTRMASRGKANVVNAHPFVHGGWIGAHNGIINNSSDLMVKSLYAPKGETDSEEAFVYLVSEKFKKAAFQEQQGWYAWSIADDKLATVMLATDGYAPLAIAEPMDGFFVWHSSLIALETSLKAIGMETRAEELTPQYLILPDLKGDKLERNIPRYQESLNLGRYQQMKEQDFAGLNLESYTGKQEDPFTREE